MQLIYPCLIYAAVGGLDFSALPQMPSALLQRACVGANAWGISRAHGLNYFKPENLLGMMAWLDQGCMGDGGATWCLAVEADQSSPNDTHIATEDPSLAKR